MIENKKFDHFSGKFLDQYFLYHPVQATLIGNHNYDDRLNSYSKQDIDALIQFYQMSANKLANLKVEHLSASNKINYRILSQHIDIKLFELNDWKRYQKDAIFYMKEIYDAIFGLQFYNRDTTEAKTRALMSRLDQIPAMIVNAMENMQLSNFDNPDYVFDQIESLKRAIAFQLPGKFNAPGSLFDSLVQKSGIVVDTLESFRKFIELNKKNPGDELLLTPEMYRTYVHLLLNTNGKLEELIKWLDSDIQTNDEDMLNTCKQIVGNSYQNRNISLSKSLFDKITGEIEKQSLNKDEIIPYCYESLEKIKRFIDEIWNLSLPIEYNIQVDWADYDIFFGLKIANLQSPGLLDPDTVYRSEIKPISYDIDWLQQLSQLRIYYNKPSLSMLMILEGVPCHYNFWIANLEKIPQFAKMFPEQTFLDGWKYYFAFSLLNAGFEGYDPELRCILLKQYARILLITKLEIQYYLQNIDKRQLERELLTSNIFKRTEIANVIYQVKYTPGRLLNIYWGVRQLKKLEERNRRQLGAQFNMNRFFQKILELGPIPIELIN